MTRALNAGDDPQADPWGLGDLAVAPLQGPLLSQDRAELQDG
jgi:hypothetical protein